MMAQQGVPPGSTTAAPAGAPNQVPQMPQFMPMPGFMPTGTLPTGDPAQYPQQQQQFGFFPTMPAMVYPQYPAAQLNQNTGF